jgi:uncharacterized protein YrrD
MQLLNTEDLYGRKLSATDGEMGSVADFYFDDQTWRIRYIVANTGSWLSGRQVLLPPEAFLNSAFGATDGDSDVLKVNLTRKQIEESPSVAEHQPVSRQYEEEYYRYYGWPNYWGASGWGGLGNFPVLTPPQVLEAPELRDEERHLRSIKEVTGYHIRASNGEIGSVSGFRISVESWAIHQLAVEAGHWYSGKTIFILPENIERVSYQDSSVLVNLTLEEIQNTAENAVAHH